MGGGPGETLANVFVLDTSALLAFLYGERGEDRVEQMLIGASEGRVSVRLHRLHLCEVYYLFHRKRGEAAAESAVRDVEKLPIHLEDRVSPVLMREAGKIKAAHRVSIADAFAVGLARLRKATLISCDHAEFEPLETAGLVQVLWAR
jgi:predicted nucleic acid-binding protein